MKTLTKKEQNYFLSSNPTLLGTTINHLGQQVLFFEHPTRGDEAPVYVWINNVLAKSDFYDLCDMIYEKGSEYIDYIPVLVDGNILLQFETVV